MFINIFGRDEEESWWDRARDECNGVVIPPPAGDSAQSKPAHAIVATNPAHHPATGKVYRPGERLERQARKFVQKQDLVNSNGIYPTPARKRRDYNTLIAQALQELG